MAIPAQDVLLICRFCLCEDEAFLISLEDILDFALSVQDVTTLTGVQITEDNIASYCMCLDCTTKLKSCINFRKTCLSNDAKFRELCGRLPAQDNGTLTIREDSGKEVCAPTAPTIEVADESSDCDISFLERILADPETEEPKPLGRSKPASPPFAFSCRSAGKPKQWQNPCQCASCLWKDISLPEADDGEAYSANYIPPGTVVCTELPADPTDFQSINPPAPPPVPPPVRKRGRRHHMCDRCGRWAVHMPSHMFQHLQHCIYSCPYCDMKTRIKASLKEHIRTVHMKLARKTCNICGRKFIHRKTYRYHMLSHEGKTFDCKGCSKTFSNAKCLQDHINRLHNAGRLLQKQPAEQRVAR
uniref:ZAD domain-containing protein n=2 Tax=Anopheles stephensi TaxID=30069 RepID=A0A182YJF3_ANOST